MNPEEFDQCFEGTERRKRCVFAEEAATKAADQVAKRMFAIFGVDIENPEKVQQCRDAFQFVVRWQKFASKGFWALTIAFLGGLGITLYSIFAEGIKALLAGNRG